MTGLSFVFMALTFAVFALYSGVADAMRGQVITRPKVIALVTPHVCRHYVLRAGRLAFESR